MGGRREGGRRKKGRRGNENRTWGHVPRAPRSSARFLRPSPRVVQNAGEPALKVGADSRITRQRRSRPLRAGVSAKKKKKNTWHFPVCSWGRTSCCPVTSTPIEGVRCDGSISLAVAVRQLWTEKIHHPIGGKRDRDSLGPSFSPTVQDLGVTQWLLGQWQPGRPSWGRRAAGGPREMDGKRG